jgi:nucleotide-binding universal stress UspA family protein
MLAIRTILHPTDFSEHSGQAFRLACSLARDHGARLIVLHVLERPVFVYGGVLMAPPPPPLSAGQREAAREQLRGLEPPDPAVPVEHLLEEGDPATATLQVAQERRCELIVMGSHGRTGLGRLLMGSVAERVVREAPCPVLIVRIPQPQGSPAEQAVPATSRTREAEPAQSQR